VKKKLIIHVIKHVSSDQTEKKTYYISLGFTLSPFTVMTYFLGSLRNILFDC